MPAAAHDDGIHVAALCPNCGVEIPHGQNTPLEAQRQIEDLQAQVRLLTDKATAAVDKWADYEDELHQLRAQQAATNRATNANTPPSTHDSLISPRPSYYPVSSQLTNRISSFLSTRKSTSEIHQQPPPPSPGERELMAALEKEQRMRQAAERKLDGASGELEELSSQLFQQANEMVAAERKARAKLEARVAVLEKRDVEKRKRLERLEGNMARIERVRGLLARS